MNRIKKLLHELNYLKAENIFQIFVFFISILPSIVYTILVKVSRRKIWLICEDKMEARDNGICLFSYVNKHAKDVIAYYAIRFQSKDYPYVKSMGRVVRYGSVFHWMLYFASQYTISTQKEGKPDAAIGYVLEQSGLLKQKFIFLQHGITLNRAEWLFYKNTKMRLYICGAEPEYRYVLEEFGYPENYVMYLGLCRFDSYFYHLDKVNKKQMVLMPSWREWISSKNEYSKVFEDTKDFRNTEYYQVYQSLINNRKLIRFLKENGITLFFYPHRNMQKYITLFSAPCRNIQIVSNETSDIRKLLIESAVMITDYSSVALDFAYMKKPVIYYQFDEERFRKAQYKEGYFSYRHSNLGTVFYYEEDVVEEVIRLFQTGFALDQSFYQAHQAFFPIWDNKNCERTYQAIKGLREL